MTRYSEENCFIKNNEWQVLASLAVTDGAELLFNSCKNIGCQRGLVKRGEQVFPSGPCPLGLIAVKNRQKADENVIKANPKFL